MRSYGFVEEWLVAQVGWTMAREEFEETARREAEFGRLRAEPKEKRQSLPAHHVRPHQFLAIEALERRIEEICDRLRTEK